MKKMRFVALLAVMLATVMLLSSCWFGGTSVKKWIDKEASFKATAVLSTMSAVSGIPDNATQQRTEGRLVYFTSRTASSPSYTVHTVYDMVENKVVTTVTNSATATYTVKLATVSVEEDSVPYFYITEDSGELSTVTLYDAAGTAVASQTEEEEPVSYCDLVYFDGIYYRMKKNGSLSKAATWSALASRPNVDVKHGAYYYAFLENAVMVYDTALQPVSSYAIPVNAYALGGDMLGTFVLENGNILIQYIVPLPDTAKKYSFTLVTEESLVKVQLHTVLVKAKNGKAKSINSEYWFLDGIVNTATDDDYVGIKPANIGWAIKPDKDTAINFASLDWQCLTLVSVNKKGKIKELKQFENEKVLDVYMVAKNRFVVETVSGREYLINEKAEVLGDIANAREYGDSFFLGGGKIYDWSLNEKYNYRAQRYTVHTVMKNAVLFEGENGEVVRYYDGNIATVISESSSTQSLYGAGNGYYVVRSTGAETSYTLYNEAGVELKTVDSMYSNVYSFEEYTLFKASNLLGEDIYFRLGK